MKYTLFLLLGFILVGCKEEAPTEQPPVFDMIPDTIERDILIIEFGNVMNNGIEKEIFAAPEKYTISEDSSTLSDIKVYVLNIIGPATCHKEDCTIALYIKDENQKPIFTDIFKGRNLKFTNETHFGYPSFTVEVAHFLQTWQRTELLDEQRYEVIKMEELSSAPQAN